MRPQFSTRTGLFSLILGLAFIACTLLLAGLPPFSGFIGKFAMLSTLLDAPGGGFWQGALDFIRSQLEAHRYILPTDLKLVRLVYSAEEAVEEINQFYANFHSTRWLKREFVVRMNHPLSDRALAHLQSEFASLRLSGEFQQLAYTGEEHDEPTFSHLTRLVFNFNGRDQGRLRGARRPLGRQHAVAAIGVDVGRALALQRGGGVAQRAGRIDDIVDQDAEAARNVTDDVHHFRFAGARAPLVDDGERGIDAVGQGTRAHDAANIRRDNHDLARFNRRNRSFRR